MHGRQLLVIYLALMLAMLLAALDQTIGARPTGDLLVARGLVTGPTASSR